VLPESIRLVVTRSRGYPSTYLTSTISNSPLPRLDVSNLIQNAAVDVVLPTALVRDIGTSGKTQRVAAALLRTPSGTVPSGMRRAGVDEHRPVPNDDPDNESKHLRIICQRSGA